VRDELVCRSLKEKSLASNVRLLVNDIDDLREAWDTLNTCYDRPDKYISEALDPVIKFRAYKAFDSGAIREFYSLLRAAMMGARKAGLLGRLINDQTLPGILARMPPADWRQWAKERPNWMREATEEAFWNFVDQKWRDALKVAAAEPPAWGGGEWTESFFSGQREEGDHQACQGRRSGNSRDGSRGSEAPPRRRGPGVYIQGGDGVHWRPPPMVLQGVREVAGEREGEIDSRQQALSVLPPTRQRQAMRGQAETSIGGVHGIRVQGQACAEAA
jgi:hypothetical protein